MIVKNASSVRSKDPLSEFKKESRKEFGKYSARGELKKSAAKVFALAMLLFLIWFVRECWLSWNIFQ